MIKRVFKVYCCIGLVNKSIGLNRVVSFFGTDYMSLLPIKLILKKILGLNFFGIFLLCDQFNIPTDLPIAFFKDIQLIELKASLLGGSFLVSGSGSNFISVGSNFCIGSFLEKTENGFLRKINQIGFLRFRRLRFGLPVRGQRSKTNARTSQRSVVRAKCFSINKLVLFHL
jgi:ribosomal protein S13